MKIHNHNITFGADPEIFVGRGGKFIPAVNMVPGNKQDPFKVDKGAVQVDGMALEFNIDPAENFDEFSSNLEIVQKQLIGMIDPGLEILNSSSILFDLDDIQDVPLENLMLGCEPDFNAYTMQVNPAPDPEQFMRTAGGHIHIGGIPGPDMDPSHHMGISGAVAKYMDEEVGVYSVLWDKDDKRRAMYGAAGCYRPKPYGMEYRTLSNSWLFNPKITKFVFDGAVRAVERFFAQDELNPEIPDIINNSRREHEFFRKNILAEAIVNDL